jgi:hypothetical protein
MLNSLCSYYKLENLGEYFNRLHHTYADEFDQYQNQCRYFQPNNIGVKLFAEKLVLKNFLKNFDKRSIIQNFTDTFNIRLYDKVILLKRQNKTDQIASTIYAVNNKKFIYLSNLEKKNNQLYIDLDDEKNIEMINKSLLNHIMIDLIKDILELYEIPFDFVDYDSATEYLLSKNIPPYKHFIDTKYSYQTMILNYEQLEIRIEKEFEFLKNILADFKLS